METKDLISVGIEEAAELLGTNRHRVTQLIKDGALPACRLGQGERDHYRIRVSDLHALFRPQKPDAV